MGIELATFGLISTDWRLDRPLGHTRHMPYWIYHEIYINNACSIKIVAISILKDA